MAVPFLSDVREEMARRMPGWIQPFLSFVTGRPLHGKTSLDPLSPITQFLLDLALLFGSVVLGVTLLDAHFFWGIGLLPVLWVVIVGRLRALVTQHAHEAVHGAVSCIPWVNRIIAQVSYTVALAHDPISFRQEHDHHHALGRFLDAQDPDRLFVESAGIRPGLSSAELHSNLWASLFGLKFHTLTMANRLRLVLFRGNGWRRACGTLWICILVGVALVGPTIPFCLVVLPALIPFFQAACLLQILSEHDWSKMDAPRDLVGYADATWGRFCGDPLPSADLVGYEWLADWGTWWLRMVFVHIPCRMGVLVRGLPAHDYHHLQSHADSARYDCAHVLHVRSRAIASGDSLGFRKREIWGLWVAVNHVLDSLSRVELPQTVHLHARYFDNRRIPWQSEMMKHISHSPNTAKTMIATKQVSTCHEV